MKNKQININKYCLMFGICSVLLLPNLANADSANGNLIIDFDQTTLMKMNGGSTEVGQRWWWVEDVFTEADNNVYIDGEFPNPTPGYDALPDPIIKMNFAVNSPDLKPAPVDSVRLLQPTTLNYSGDPTTGSGKIGISGAFRIRSDSRKGYLLPKDMTLAFYPERVGKGGQSLYEEGVTGGYGESGWAIMTNEDYFGTQALFDLTNVTTSTENGALKLTGDLIWAAEWGSFLLLDRATVVGKVSLEPTGARPVDGNGTNNPVVVPTFSGIYDDATQVVDIKDIQALDSRYSIQLQRQADGLFTLKSALPLGSSVQIDGLPATYDSATQNLVIPKVKAFGKTFSVWLKNIGGYQFSLEQINEL